MSPKGIMIHHSELITTITQNYINFVHTPTPALKLQRGKNPFPGVYILGHVPFDSPVLRIPESAG